MWWHSSLLFNGSNQAGFNMQLQAMIDRAREIQNLYRVHNEKAGEKRWEVSQYVQGLVSDAGDLNKLMMAHEGHLTMDDVPQKLEHEVVDCLWAVLVIASELNIDLAEAFPREMDTLQKRITG